MAAFFGNRDEQLICLMGGNALLALTENEPPFYSPLLICSLDKTVYAQFTLAPEKTKKFIEAFGAGVNSVMDLLQGFEMKEVIASIERLQNLNETTRGSLHQ